MDLKAHWDAVYQAKAPEQLSWFQSHPQMSLDFIRYAAPDRATAILDVGGGASTLVDDLVANGYRRVCVLDLSAAALEHARRRLGIQSPGVTWLEADILDVTLPTESVDLWHDRAVFHFLTDPVARQQYVQQVRRLVRPGGFVLVATFAADGPSRCSGLEVARYTPEGLHAEFGSQFRPLRSQREAHPTPWGAQQAFTYCLCRYDPEARVQPAA